MNDFLFVDNWFYNKYFTKLEQGHRFWTMQTAISLFLQAGGNNIVETGCLRMENDWGAGMSTLVFADITTTYDKDLYSVDINKGNLDIAQDMIQKYLSHYRRPFLITSDSVQYLKDFGKQIDLLYLDSLDFDFDNPSSAQDHCLSEVEAAYSVLSRKAVVLFDDNRLPNGGKPAKAKLWLQGKGWKCIMDYHQSLWIREI